MPSAKSTGKGSGIPNLRVAGYPGPFAVHPYETLRKNIAEVTFPQVLELLTQPPEAGEDAAAEPGPRDIVFEGTFDEVNEFSYTSQWSDGLPIVPPTIEKVEEFLKYADRSPDEVIGILSPAKREASIWSIAVNGVMAGCRPEYMPVLVAIVEVLADPRYGVQESGSTSGWAPIIILNGPIIEQLDFNTSTGVLRVGRRANTSVGRFLRLYMRNVPGFVPGILDMGQFGRPNYPVLAEDEALSPWEPLSVTRGFEPGVSTVTIASAGTRSFDLDYPGTAAEQTLGMLAEQLKPFFLAADMLNLCFGPEMCPILVLAPMLAKQMADEGYSKKDVQEYIYEHTMITARDFEYYYNIRKVTFTTACELVEAERLPAHYCLSDDPERMVPLFHDPDELQVIVAGTEGRNRAFAMWNLGRQGLTTSKQVKLPANWDELLAGLGT